MRKIGVLRGLVQFCAVVLLISGCATFSFTPIDVNFEDPAAKLGIVNVLPTVSELKGIQLRLLMPSDRTLKAVEETSMFHFIRDGRGIEVAFSRNIKEQFEPVKIENAFLVRSESDFKGIGGYMNEESVVSTRGEILKFVQAVHKTEYGKLRIVEWKRSPIFPEAAVRIGDEWSYEESIDARIDSLWIKYENPTPFTIKAKSKLAGFAEVNGRRTAVVDTEIVESKRESFKVLFKEFVMNIHAQVKETTYLDYVSGMVVARVDQTKSFATSEDGKVTNEGESQSLYYLKPSI